MDLKTLGNQAFANNKYDEAIELYTKALLKDPQSAVLYSNRALCQIKLNNYDKGLQDCDSGLSYVDDEKTKVKLLFRKATCFKAMKSYKLSKLYFQQVIDLDPNNEPAKRELSFLKPLQASVSVTGPKVNIPIEMVDELPSDFAKLLTNSNDLKETPQMSSHQPSTNNNLDSVIDELLSSRPSKKQAKEIDQIPFTERPTMTPLMALKSIPGANKQKAYEYVITLPITSLIDDLSYAIEPEFLSFYIEAAAFVAESNSVPNWQSLILNNLKQLSTLKRFLVSKEFVSKNHLMTLYANLKDDMLEEYKSIFL